MRSEQAKGADEIKIFLRFMQAVDLPIAAGSVEKRDPPEPDLRCIHALDGQSLSNSLSSAIQTLRRQCLCYRRHTYALQIARLELFRRNFGANIQRIFRLSCSAIQMGESLLQMTSSFPLWPSTCDHGGTPLGEHGSWAGREYMSSGPPNSAFELTMMLAVSAPLAHSSLSELRYLACG